jgi:predicted component of type VI protein secretion system
MGLGEAISTLGRLSCTADPLGTGHADAVVRIRCARTFAAGGFQVERIQPASDGTWDLYTRALNLAGAGGTLPETLDRLAFDPAGRDSAILAALDRWTHAAVSVWYEEWTAHPASGGGGPFGVPGELFVRPRTFANLARAVEWFAGFPAVAVPCVGAWARRWPEGLNTRFTRLGRCRLVVGPVSYDAFVRLRATGPEFEKLLQLADVFCDGMVGFEVVVTAAGAAVPPAEWAARGARPCETYRPDPNGKAAFVVPAERCDALLGRRGR